MSTAAPSARLLTKSLFLKARECPRKLAYKLNRGYDEQKPSGLVDHLTLNGKKLGVYARLLFPSGIEVGAQQVSASVDELVQETTHLLQTSDTVTLFEAAIRSGPYYIRTDILRKVGPAQLQLMEVKAKSWDSRSGRTVGRAVMTTKTGDIKAEYLPYLNDVAFQKWVLHRAFPEFTVQASLILPDKGLKNTKIPNLNALFRVIPSNDIKEPKIHLHEQARETILSANEVLVTQVHVDDLVDQVLRDGTLKGEEPSLFDDLVPLWGTLYAEMDADVHMQVLKPALGSQCRDCEFRTCTQKKDRTGFQQCWQEMSPTSPENHQPQHQDNCSFVCDLYYGGKTVDKLIAQEKYRFSDVTPEDLGVNDRGQDPKKKGPGMTRKEKQWLHVTAPSTPVLDHEYLQQEMAKWQYPFHFIDFETVTPVLPYFTEMSPFELLAFQFSHHAMQQDGTIEHVSEFLCTTPGECPNQPFLRALSATLVRHARSGTILCWGAHERTVLTSLLRHEQPGTYLGIEALLDSDHRMVDLMTFFSKGYYAPGSGASSSIKKLLLPTMGHSGRLHDLYARPTYSSRNFTNMQWWVESESSPGEPLAPYALLGTVGGGAGVAQGGDALAAYETLQRDDLDEEERAAQESSLLRYCELDTLAMAMMVQGIQDLMGKQHERVVYKKESFCNIS